MLGFLAQRTRTSLRVRLLLATVALLAVALAVAAVAFERAARSVIVAAVHSHLSARAQEVHDAVVRFQAERDLSVRSWAEAEAMQMTLDSGDGKFAEDYLRRVIQGQNGAVAAAALLGIDGEIMAAVRVAAADQRLGAGVAEVRGLVVTLPVVTAITTPPAGAPRIDADELVAYRDDAEAIGPFEALLPGTKGDVLYLAAPVKDFAGDLCGFMVAVIERAAFSSLLAEVNGKETAFRPVLADASGKIPVSLPGVPQEELLPVLSAPAGAPGTLEHIDPPGATPLLAVRVAAAANTVPGWSTLMTVPQSTAFGQLYWLRGMLAMLFAVVLAAAGIGSVVAIRQAGRPLTDVAASMAKVAGGDLSTRVASEYSDELGHLVKSFNVMVEEVEKSRDELQRTEALRREVQIAHQIQTAILPVSPAVKGYEVAARMKPADDVGGDLYDILAFDDTFWVLVGDVSGHGINSGLVMMMAQAAAYGAIADDPHCSPKDVIAAVNRVVHENVRKRMKRDDYLTLMAARHLGDGRFLAAGAHQPIFIARGGGFIEVVESVGPWVGLTANPPGVEEYEFTVGPGESVCLVTDGILEATDKDGELFDQERLSAVLGAVGAASASEVLRVLFSAVEVFQAKQADDMTAVVLRRKE